jgi:hypothetical protein
MSHDANSIDRLVEIFKRWIQIIYPVCTFGGYPCTVSTYLVMILEAFAHNVIVIAVGISEFAGVVQW